MIFNNSLLIMSFFAYFASLFFFQAEDGIRDTSVTGVQTCALPISELGPKLGPVLFQLPPNLKKDVARLGDLLTQFPPDIRCAWEFRHESWFSDDVYELLRKGNAALCIADTDEATTPLVSTAHFGYFRLRDEGYSKKDLEKWAGQVKELGREWQGAFIFFKHEESGGGV